MYYEFRVFLVVLQDHIGNEVEIGVDKSDEKNNFDLGSYISIEYLRSLEEKIQQQAKVFT